MLKLFYNADLVDCGKIKTNALKQIDLDSFESSINEVNKVVYISTIYFDTNSFCHNDGLSELQHALSHGTEFFIKKNGSEDLIAVKSVKVLRNLPAIKDNWVLVVLVLD